MNANNYHMRDARYMQLSREERRENARHALRLTIWAAYMLSYAYVIHGIIEVLR